MDQSSSFAAARSASLRTGANYYEEVLAVKAARDAKEAQEQRAQRLRERRDELRGFPTLQSETQQRLFTASSRGDQGPDPELGGTGREFSSSDSNDHGREHVSTTSTNAYELVAPPQIPSNPQSETTSDERAPLYTEDHDAPADNTSPLRAHIKLQKRIINRLHTKVSLAQQKQLQLQEELRTTKQEARQAAVAGRMQEASIHEAQIKTLNRLLEVSEAEVGTLQTRLRASEQQISELRSRLHAAQLAAQEAEYEARSREYQQERDHREPAGDDDEGEQVSQMHGAEDTGEARVSQELGGDHRERRHANRETIPRRSYSNTSRLQRMYPHGYLSMPRQGIPKWTLPL